MSPDVITKETKEVGDNITAPINPADPDLLRGYCCDAVGHVVGSESPDCCSLESTLSSCDDDTSTSIVDYGRDLIRIGIDYMCEYTLASAHGLKAKLGLSGYCEIPVDTG